MSDHPRYRGPVIDSHCHSDGRHRSAALAALTAAGISGWLNLWNLDWPPPSFSAWQREVAGRDAPQMGLAHAPDLSDVGDDGFAARLEAGIHEAADAGAAALKVWKNLGLTLRDTDGRLVAIDDPRLEGLWSVAGQTELPIVIHVADPVAFFAPLDSDNERWEELQAHPDWWFGGGQNPGFGELIDQLERVIGRHPETTFIGAHVGCYAEDLGRVGAMLEAYPNYYVDTSARIAEIGRRDPDQVREFFISHADRILFGSDFCRTAHLLLPGDQDAAAEREFFARYWRYFETDETGLEHPIPVQGHWRVNGIALPEETLEQLYWGNSARVLPGLHVAQARGLRS